MFWNLSQQDGCVRTILWIYSNSKVKVLYNIIYFVEMFILLTWRYTLQMHERLTKRNNTLILNVKVCFRYSWLRLMCWQFLPNVQSVFDNWKHENKLLRAKRETRHYTSYCYFFEIAPRQIDGFVSKIAFQVWEKIVLFEWLLNL